MHIDRFIEDYKEFSSKDVQEKFVKGILNTAYIPYMKKVKTAERCLKENLIDEYMIECRTPQTYLAYIMSVLKLFTTLEFDDTDKPLVYDKLQNYGLVDMIITLLKEDGCINEYDVIYRMCQQDFETNHLSVRGFVQNQVKHFSSVCNDNIVKLTDVLKRIDWEKLIRK